MSYLQYIWGALPICIPCLVTRMFTNHVSTVEMIILSVSMSMSMSMSMSTSTSTSTSMSMSMSMSTCIYTYTNMYIRLSSLYGIQVWVRQKVVENDMSLFIELPQHLRAEVAWHWNKPILDKIYIFKVCYKALLTMILLQDVTRDWHPDVMAPGPFTGVQVSW